MGNRYLRAIAHPAETVRTAPYGIGSVASGMLTEGIFVPTLIENANSGNVTGVAAAGFLTVVGLTNIGYGAMQVARQFHIRERLEESVSRQGYNERVFAVMTDEWCTRQNALQVARQHEFAEEYRELCERRASTAGYRWLPNF